MIEITMPKNGMDMEEGTLIRWLKNEGDRVEKDEPVMEIETDKVTMESESPAAGILLKKTVGDGAVVPVFTVLGYIGEEGEKIPDSADSVQKAEKAADAAAASAVPVKEETVNAEKTSGYDYDIAVIGAGPGGYVAAIRAAQLGANVVVFEKDSVGGTCLNRGCIPTKTYVKTAEYIHHIRNAASRGIVSSAEAGVDMPAVVAHKDKVVRQLTGGVGSLLKSNGCTLIKGEARFADSHTIECEGKKYTVKKTIIASGSDAVRLPIPGIDSPKVLTSTGFLEMTELPKRLCIIGGGVIGCEMAAVFSTFGSKVSIVEGAERILLPLDPDSAKEIDGIFRKNGIDIFVNEPVKSFSDRGGSITVETPARTIECDRVLLSIGRKAVCGCVGALHDTLRMERGNIVADDCMRTSVEDVYAIGDVNGKVMLAHAASMMGETAAENAVLGTEKKCDLSVVPSIVYTSPEAAGVGLTEPQARNKHPEGLLIGSFPFSANSRSVASGEREGFVKVIAEKKYGEILGVHIVGSCASEMIAEAAALMDAEASVYDVAEDMIHAHPTYSEAFMEACKDCIGQCIHMPPGKK